MKIRTKDGKVFDLVGARKAWGPLGSEAGPLIHALLDALEAALDVPRYESTETRQVPLAAIDFAKGHNTALRSVRQAAGVIEEPG